MSFEDINVQNSNGLYFLPTVEVKDYDIMIDGRNYYFFDQPVKNDLGKYDNIQKIATGQGNDYTLRSLLDFPYFKKY